MLNPIFLKKVQGQNILGGERLQNTKYLVPKMWFKTNTNCHKHPSISLFLIEQDTIDETKKTMLDFYDGIVSEREREGESYVK